VDLTELITPGRGVRFLEAVLETCYDGRWPMPKASGEFWQGSPYPKVDVVGANTGGHLAPRDNQSVGRLARHKSAMRVSRQLDAGGRHESPDEASSRGRLAGDGFHCGATGP